MSASDDKARRVVAKGNFAVVRKPPPASVQLPIQRDEIRKNLIKVKDAHVRSRERIVANWSERSRPGFSGQVQAGPKRAGIIIKVTGGKLAKKIWDWLDRTGTKPHEIRPKPSNKRGLLVFPWGGPGSYQAKTGQGPSRFGGPGTVRNAVIRFFKRVSHPGFRPRNFSLVINKDLEPDFLKAIKNGGARGLRRAKKAR